MTIRILQTAFLSLFLGFLLRGQTISTCEYWFDDHYAGRQNAPLSINGSTATFDGSASTVGLSVGGHIFNYRCRDAAGKYSGIVSQFFIKRPANTTRQIVAYEYWFDNDAATPTARHLTSVSNPSTDFSFDKNIDASDLALGGHILNVRFKDDIGNWSGIVSQFFIKIPSQTGQNLITGYEFWFDNNDRNRTYVTRATPSVFVTLSRFSTASLDTGVHILRVRFKDSRGNWSGILSQSFRNDRNATSCVAWTNPPLSNSEAALATDFLCQSGIITTAQNGTTNATTKITRGEIARLIFRALLADDETNDARFPFLDFPTPFCDLRRANKTEEWYRAAMCLSYLQYDDNISPFNRKYFRFGADTFMRRRHFFQVLFESCNIKPAASSVTPFDDVTDQTVLPYYKKYIRKAADLGLATGSNFRPSDWLTVEEFYIFLYRLLKSGQNTPTIDQIDDEANYFIPGNYTVENLNRLPKMDNGNFNHYSKTSFNIAGRGLPLEFTHTYNSFWTELPTEFFTNPDPNDATAQNQRFNPLGIGWTHSYNIYIQRVNAGNAQCSEGWLIFWADGTIHVYDPIARQYNTQGIYDDLSFEDFAVDSQRVVITTKNQIRYTFTGKKGGKLLYLRSIKERNDNGLALEYSLSDPANSQSFLRLSRVYEVFNNNTSGRALTFNYPTGLPFLQSVSDNIGRTIQFEVYDELEDLTKFTDAKGQITRYDYTITEGESDHLLKTITLPKGNKIENTYQQRKLTSSKTTTGHKVEVQFQNNYRAGASGTTHYSAAMVKTTQPNGGTYTTEYKHNLSGDPLSMATPATTIQNIQYGTGQNIRKPTSLNANGQNVSMAYDTKGNLTRVMRENIEENFEYDTKNNLKRHTDAKGFITRYEYDGTSSDRNLVRIIRPSGGGQIDIQRNSFGQIERVTNPTGIQTQYDYDPNGNLNTTRLPLSITSGATYDNASRLKTTTDPKGNLMRFDYDNNDNVIEELDAFNQRTTYGYDANENLTRITNAKNESTNLLYSPAEDYLTSQTFGLHKDSFEYNLDGSLKRLIKPTATFTYTYDDKGRTTSDGFTTYAYDNRNRITEVTYQGKTIRLFYDALDRLDYYTDYYGNTVDYGYDNNGNVTTITYPSNKTVTYAYDNNNRMTTVTDWNNRILATYSYLTDDRLDSVVFHNGTRTVYGYDAAGRMTSLVNKRSNQTIVSSYQFTLDKIGNHETETVNEPALAAAVASLTPRSVPYGASPFNRLSSADNNTFGYDNTGNQTQRGNESLSFDAYNRLVSATNAQYDYDGSGNRRSRTLNGTTTRYVLDILGMSQILIETDATNTPQYFYVYGASGLICRLKPDNTTHFYHYDFRGSTTAMTDAAQNISHQYSYDPFGKILAATEADANPFRYVGQHGVVYETPNRYFMRARFYDPSVGRFLSEDPVWDKNLYAYANNNPITEYDPDGNKPLKYEKSLKTEEGFINKNYGKVSASSDFDLHPAVFNAYSKVSVTAGELQTFNEFGTLSTAKFEVKGGFENYGLKAGIMYSTFEGTLNHGVNVLGFDIDFELSGNVGSIGGELEFGKNGVAAKGGVLYGGGFSIKWSRGAKNQTIRQQREYIKSLFR
jgi:RHS repeat-associated protein